MSKHIQPLEDLDQELEQYAAEVYNQTSHFKEMDTPIDDSVQEQSYDGEMESPGAYGEEMDYGEEEMSQQTEEEQEMDQQEMDQEEMDQEDMEQEVDMINKQYLQENMEYDDEEEILQTHDIQNNGYTTFQPDSQKFNSPPQELEPAGPIVSEISKQIQKERQEEAQMKVDQNAVNNINPNAKKFTQVTVLGDNKYGQLGFDQDEFLKVPKTLSFNIYIRSMACGQNHTHLVAADGSLYSMGSNKHGQLGLGFAPDLLAFVKFPTLVADINVKKVTCGYYHSLAIDPNGFVHGWGLADHGAIGVRVSSSYEPSVIQFNQDVQVKDISCGANHSLFLSSKGEAYSCGLGDKGQLGIGFISIKEYRPIVIRLRDYDEKIQQISCGANFTLFLTKTGKIFSTGENNEGQLGLANKNQNVSWPEVVEESKYINFRQISCGRYSSAIDEIGNFYAWGHFNGYNSDKPKCPDMVQTQFVNILQSDTISAAVDIEGKLWAWSNYSETEIRDAWKKNKDIVPLKLPTIPRSYEKTRYKLMAQIHVGHDYIVAIATDQPAHKFFEKPVVKAQKSSNLRKSLNRSKSREITMQKPLESKDMERKIYQTIIRDEIKEQKAARRPKKNQKYELTYSPSKCLDIKYKIQKSPYSSMVDASKSVNQIRLRRSISKSKKKSEAVVEPVISKSAYLQLMMEKERLQTKVNEFQKNGNEYKYKYKELKNSVSEKYRYFREQMDFKEKELKKAQKSFQEVNEQYERLSREFDDKVLKLQEMEEKVKKQNQNKDFEEQIKYWKNELRLQENVNHEIMQINSNIVSENSRLQATNEILEKMNRSLTESNLSQHRQSQIMERERFKIELEQNRSRSRSREAEIRNYASIQAYKMDPLRTSQLSPSPQRVQSTIANIGEYSPLKKSATHQSSYNTNQHQVPMLNMLSPTHSRNGSRHESKASKGSNAVKELMPQVQVIGPKSFA